MRSRSTVQSPAAYDAANLQGSQIAARLSSDQVTARIVDSVTATTRHRMAQALQDAGYRYVIAPEETAAGLTEGDLTFGYELGDLRRYGAVGDGVADDSAALQTAANVGRIVVYEGTYRINTGATRVGTVYYEGRGGTLLCDGVVLEVTDGPGSEVRSLVAENITAPWIITRDPTDWGADISGTLRQSNEDGYQPTINDQDIWDSLTEDQQNQNIGPQLIFQGDSTSIHVQGVRGRFVSIVIYDGQDCLVEDVDIRGGKNFAGAILFWNQTAGRLGRRNWAKNINVRYSSYNSVTFRRNYDGGVENVRSYRNGESGVKFWKGDGTGGVSVRCYNMQVRGTVDIENYFDGPDLSGDIPPTSSHSGSHMITDVQSYGCGGTGLNIDGAQHVIRGVKAWNCHSFGIWATGLTNSVLADVVLQDNNTQESNTRHDLVMDGGNNNVVSNVRVIARAAGQYSIYAPGTNYWNNVLVNRAPFFGNPGSVTSVLLGVTDTSGYPGVFNRRVTEAVITGGDEHGVDIWPRAKELSAPSARMTALIANGTPGAHYSWVRHWLAQAGALVEYLRGFVESGQNVPAVAISAPNSAPSSAAMTDGSITAYLDESGNNLKFRVRYSNGTVKTATVALT